jgi:hypothetical protein
VPESSTLEAGFERAFHLEVQTADGKWYSVTNRPEARIAKEDPASPLELEEGTKNVFMVPSDTPFGMDGKTATLVGTFTPPGQEPMTARAVVTIQVPD